MFIYTVKAGDTVFEIAKRYGISDRLITEVNGLSDPSRLTVGQALILPKPQDVHTVMEGETLSSIARAYGVSKAVLWRNNPTLKGQDRLSVGEELVIHYDNSNQSTLAVNGFAYPFIRTDTLNRTLPYLSSLTSFCYGFTSEGDLVMLSDDAMLRDTRSYGVEPIMLLTTLNSEGKFDNSLSHTLLDDDVLQEYLISNLLALMHLKGYRTLFVDFEFVFPEDRLLYVDFLKRIKRSLAPYRYSLWVALAPKTSSDQIGLLYEGHDYRLIGDVADRVQLMTYEWGYRYGEAYAVAPCREIQRVVDYAVTEIPREKILIGIPNYGRDIVLSSPKGQSEMETVSCQRAISLAYEKKAEIIFDEIAKSPYFRYYQDGMEHRVWFEDARSIQAKLTIADQNNLLGISIWNCMEYFPQGYFLLSAYRIH